MIINGNNLEVLDTFPDNYFDSVVTDPPYGLKFMGKKWDYDVPSVELWQKVYRVLKPGGHVLSFGGSRTYHRMAVAIEDAGFEIRDMIEWVYASGFPKSLDVAKALNKMAGVEFKAKPASGVGFMNSNDDGYNITLNQLIQTGESTMKARKWKGWGTALKPAHEPCVLARKPIEGNVAQNCLKYGVGGLNIDGSRVETKDNLNGGMYSGTGKAKTVAEHKWGFEKRDGQYVQPTGRFPANLIHDGSEEVLEVFPVNYSSGKVKLNSEINRTVINTDRGNGAGIVEGRLNKTDSVANYGDSGSAARFFYCAKVSKSERNIGLEGKNNHHPTVKPIALMSYLVKLITPKGGIVLDPFNGSGSTGIACKKEGMEYVGIELDPEYCKISEARIKAFNKPLI